MGLRDFRLGISSFAYRWAFGFGPFRPYSPMKPEDLISFASSRELHVVQLCDNTPWFDLSDLQLRALHEYATEKNIDLETGIRGTNPLMLAEAIRKSVLIGSDLIRIVIELERDGPESIELQLRETASELGKVLRLARDAGVALALENHASVTAAELCRLIGMVDDSICGVCVDTMNSVLLLEKPDETVSLLAPYAFTVHLKDFITSKNSDNYQIVGTPLGEGLLDLPELLLTLSQNAAIRSLHVELYIPRMTEEKETLDCEARAVETSIENLKASIRM